MKDLNNYIIEKLKIRKRTTEVLTNEQLNMLFLYCMCYLGDEDLCEEAIDNHMINWGEMERYSRFNIDWYDSEHNWISDYGCDNYEKHEAILNLMDEFADTIIWLLIAIIKVTKNDNDNDYDSHRQGILREFLFYIMEYIENYNSSSNIDLTEIQEIDKKINNRTVRILYKDSKRWNYIIKDNKVIDACQKVYDAALELINK